jgi:hypothetical protein
MRLSAGVWLHITLVAAVSASAGQNLNPKVLLDKYDACNKKLETVSFELETILEQPGKETGKRVYEIKYCSRNREKQWIGQWTQYNPDGTIDRGSSQHLIDIYADKVGLHFTYFGSDMKVMRPPTASLTRVSRDQWMQDYIEHAPYGGPLMGRLDGSNRQSIQDLLKEAGNLKAADKPTKLIGYDAYLVEADTKYGIVRAWIAPDAGYNCLRWEIIKKQDQFYRDGSVTRDEFTRRTDVFDAEKVEQVEGQYVVTQARLNNKVEDGPAVLGQAAYHYRLKNIDLSPDYEALEAFEIQLPEGVVVRDIDRPGILYQWVGGQLVTAPAQPARRPAPVKPEVVLPPKPEGWKAPRDISPVSRDNVTGHVKALAALESRHITQPGNKKAEEYILRELQKYGYAPRADAFQARNMTLHNVIADGSDKQTPVILLSAHFDSCVGGRDSQPSQAPGADDNASGVAVLLELARILKEYPVPTNVEFAFFNGEESGRDGSEHLSNKYRDNHWPIDYVINVDTVGTWKGTLSHACPVNFVTNADSVPVIRQLAEQFPYPLRQAKSFWSDDHASFWHNGFKAIEITEDDSTVHMHKLTDTPEKLDYDNIARIVHGLYVVLSQSKR